MLSYELEYIKVPEGFARTSRENGIFRSMIFWYKLKPIYKLGNFAKISFYKTIKSFYNISDSNIRLHLNRLIKMGLIKEFKDSYQLVSYDKLFHHFHYNLSYKRSKNNKIIRKGNFALQRISVDHLDVIEDRIDCGEIKLNIRRQEYFVNKVVCDEKRMSTKPEEHIVEKNIRSNIFYNCPNIKLSSNTISDIRNSLSFQVNDNKKVNLITGISCKAISKLLGFKSTKSVHDLKYRAAKYGLIHLYDQKVVLRKSCSFMDDVILHRVLQPTSYLFKSEFGGILTYQLCDYFFFSF